MKTFKISSLSELSEIARYIILEAQNHPVIALRGEMGAGKTTLVAAIAKELNVSDAVSSPTFALVNNYETEDGKTLYHFDFYRIESLGEVFDLGYEEYFDSGAMCLIEWAEKIEALLPNDVLNVCIEVLSPTEREIRVVTPLY